MARYLALDGDTNLVQLLSANVKGNAVRLERSLVWEEGLPVSAANAEEVGGRLREQLKTAGIAPAPLLVCVGRDRVILKEIKIPAVAVHEEPALVRFQALKEFTDGGDEVVLDYVPLGPAGPDGRRVQVMSVRKELVKAYRTLAEQAGLKLAAVTPRPFALMAGLLRAIRSGDVPAPQPESAPVGLLVRGHKWGEFVIVRNGTLVLSRSVAGPALASDAALLGEIRRNLALHANQNADSPVRALYLAEADTPGGLRERLQESLAVPVYAYEPVVGVPVPDGPPGGLAGLAGLLALRAAGEPGINFAQPREPKAPVDPNKRLLTWGAVAAVLLVGLLGGFAYTEVSARGKAVAALQREHTKVKDELASLDAEAKQIKALEEWRATNVNWLDELYDMAARVKDPDSLRILTISVVPIQQPTTAARPGRSAPKSQGKHAFTVEIQGMAKNLRLADDFVQALKDEDPRFRVGSLLTKQRRDRGDQQNGFTMEFTVKVDVEARPADQYTRTIPNAPARRRGGRDAVAAGEGGDQ